MYVIFNREQNKEIPEFKVDVMLECLNVKIYLHKAMF